MMTYFTLQATEPEESDGERLNVFGHICAEISFSPKKNRSKSAYIGDQLNDGSVCHNYEGIS